jgi:hypothetical protein
LRTPGRREKIAVHLFQFMPRIEPIRMPVTNCPDCREQVSTTATQCPHCGGRLSPEELEKQAAVEREMLAKGQAILHNITLVGASIIAAIAVGFLIFLIVSRF